MMIRWNRFARAKSRGFTLTELMVVVAIFSLLAGFAIVSIGRTNRAHDLDDFSREIASMMTVARRRAVTTRNVYLVSVQQTLTTPPQWTASYCQVTTNPETITSTVLLALPTTCPQPPPATREGNRPLIGGVGAQVVNWAKDVDQGQVVTKVPLPAYVYFLPDGTIDTDFVSSGLQGFSLYLQGNGGAQNTSDTLLKRKIYALPFAGLKVLDFGHGGVGVETGRLFAEYGADVIKVETRTYPDFIRMVSGTMTSPSFVSSSRSKRSLGANAKVDQGRELLYRMIEWADVLIENTSTGTMADLQLDAATVRAINPRLVYVSSQLMGSRGHWKDWIGYGPNTRPAAGMSYLWNFPDGGMPPGAMAIHPDHVVGRMVAAGAAAALLGRDATGQGAHVETAQVETIVNFLSDQFLRESLVPGSAQPEGNRSERGAPWGVYRCAGNERWCAITVRDDADWQRLRAAIGDPEWARSADYDTAAGRHAAHDEIDERLTEWTSLHSDREVMEILQAAGVPAGASLYPSDFVTDAHHAARGFVVEIDQPGLGHLALEGPAIEASGMPRPYIAPAPALAEHTREIAREILGLTDDEIDAAAAAGALELPG